MSTSISDQIRNENRITTVEHGLDDTLKALIDIKAQLVDIKKELDEMKLKFAKAGGVILVLMFIATSFGVVISNLKQILGIVPTN